MGKLGGSLRYMSPERGSVCMFDVNLSKGSEQISA